MEFAQPQYFFLLILLVPLVVWYIFKLRKVQASLKVSSVGAFSSMPKTLRVHLRHMPFIIRIVIIVLVVAVLARPQASNTLETSSTEGIDIIVALDVSGSMLAQDFKPNRLEAAKKLSSEFISSREQDKIGLVIFAGESFTQAPLTIDHGVLLNLLNGVNPKLIQDGTAIGLGLANSVNRLKDSKSKSRIVILLTDGSNNRGQIAPLTAAEVAKEYGIRVYTIGVGTQGMAPSPVMTPFGERVQMVPVDIDEKTLTEIANITGGQYFRALDNTGLKQIYAEIDAMEKYLINVNRVTRKSELYLPYALWAIGLLLLEIGLRRTWLRNIP
ncbi:MAG: hypothetical protein RL662_956 [Bacteroidota bacterium]|jgi:Ca-activated chloride channel family protein